MGAIDTTYTFTATDTITSTKMNDIIDQTTFTNEAVFDTTLAVAAGKLKVNSQGITSNELAAGSVVTSKIVDANVTTAKIADDAITSDKIALGAIIPNLPSNFPIQVVGVTKSDIQTITNTSTSWIDVTGLSITLTRSVPSASGKVRIQAVVGTTSNEYRHGVALRILKDGAVIDSATGDADGLRVRATALGGYSGEYASSNVIVDYIDMTPGNASSVTYKIQARIYSILTGFVNKSLNDADNTDFSFRTISTMTLTELTP